MRGAEGALDPALLAGRTDLPPLTTDDAATDLALVDWGDGVLTLRAADGRYLSVPTTATSRASADQPGGWVVQETFRLEPHGDGHLLLHMGTGRYVVCRRRRREGCRGSRREADVFELEVVERGEDAVARAAAAADAVVVVAGNDPHINGRETEDRHDTRPPAQQERAAARRPRRQPAHGAGPESATRTRSTPRTHCPPCCGPRTAARRRAPPWPGCSPVTSPPPAACPRPGTPPTTDLPGLLDYDVIGSAQTYLYFEGDPALPVRPRPVVRVLRLRRPGGARRGRAVHVAVHGHQHRCGDAPTRWPSSTRAPPSPRSPGRAASCSATAGCGSRRASRTELSFEVPLSAFDFWDVAHGRLAAGVRALRDPGRRVQRGRPAARRRSTSRASRPRPRPVLQRGLAAGRLRRADAAARSSTARRRRATR